jgi:hypothetical protein
MRFAEIRRMKITAGGSTERGILLFGALACFACACVTLDDGHSGVPLDAANRPLAAAAPPPLVVSASEAASYSSAYLGLVEVTFENRTAVWKQVDRVSVDFGSPAKNQTVTIASADDIDAWERSIVLGGNPQGIYFGPAGYVHTAIEAHGVGSVERLAALIGPRHRAEAAPGAAGTPAAPGAPAAAGAQASAVPPPPSYPAQHLLTTPFRVPPGLFAKRWILLSTPDNPPGGCVDFMILSYETSDHATGRVLVPFKVRTSDWQGPACNVIAPLSANPNR